MKSGPRLAVWKFASCDGCQLALLDCEDQLLELTASVEIAQFREVSRASAPGPYDISLVEGSITTTADLERIREVRRESRHLVAIGACATAGGIQALRNLAAPGSYPDVVYPHPEYLDSLDRSTPISAHVPVDFELHGCPVDSRQLVEVVTAFLAGRRPVIPDHSVCQQCKEAGQVCVMVGRRIPCMGPVTRAGCGARCPAVGRGCYGCFGPVGSANTPALAECMRDLGATGTDIGLMFRTFNATAPAWSDLSNER